MPLAVCWMGVVQRLPAGGSVAGGRTCDATGVPTGAWSPGVAVIEGEGDELATVALGVAGGGDVALPVCDEQPHINASATVVSATLIRR